MRVLFHFVSLPLLTNESNLFSSLINEFVRQGHSVKVTTKGSVDCETSVSCENGIDILRIKCDDFTGVANKVKKALAYVKYSFLQTKLVKRFWGNESFDLIITHSLPPELGFIVKRFKRFFKCPVYLLLTDFTWQDAVAYGYFKKNGLIGLYYRYWEKVLFKNVDYIAVPTEGNKTFLVEQFPWIQKKSFSVFPFWQKPVETTDSKNVLAGMGLADKFVVIYGGSVGPAQKVEHLVYLAESLRDNTDIVFLVLGKGSGLDIIKQMSQERQLQNIVFRDFMPQEDYLQLLSSCGAGVIILNEKHATPNFPSKTCSYFNLKVPVLASIDYVTDFGKFLDETGTGLWSYSGDNDSFRNNLLCLYRDKQLWESIREKEYFYFFSHMLPSNAYHSIMEQISE